MKIVKTKTIRQLLRAARKEQERRGIIRLLEAHGAFQQTERQGNIPMKERLRAKGLAGGTVSKVA